MCMIYNMYIYVHKFSYTAKLWEKCSNFKQSRLEKRMPERKRDEKRSKIDSSLFIAI